MNISSLNTALRAFKGKSSFIIQESNGSITIKKLDYQNKIVNFFYLFIYSYKNKILYSLTYFTKFIYYSLIISYK